MKKENLNIEQQLERLKNENVFKVPENYFENFAERLSVLIREESKPKIYYSWVNYYLKPVFGIAAVLTILFLLVYVPVKYSFEEDQNLTEIRQMNSKSETIDLNEQLASFETLIMLPQSQFLSALEEVENTEDADMIDSKELGEYLADNSFDYELFRNN